MGAFDDLLGTDAGTSSTGDGPAPNPYKPGSEEWSWYNDQLERPTPAKTSTFSDLLPEPAAAAPAPVWHGSILPISRNSTGSAYFDPFGAGPIGAARKAFTLPGRVMSGEVQMPQTFDPAANDPNVQPLIGEATNFAGTFGAGVNPMIRSGDRVVPGVKMAPKDINLAVSPTGEALKEVGGKQIEQFKNMAIPYNPSYMGTLAANIEQKLVSEGKFPEDAPGLYKSIARLRDFVPRSADPSASISVGPANLISIRKNIASKFGVPGEDQYAVGLAHDAFNQFLEKPPKEALVAGAPAFLAEYGPQRYAEGRANYSAGMRDAELAAIQRESRLRSRSANSGQNVDNTVRSRVTSAILNAKKLKGFPPEEEAMLEAVPEGSIPRNAARITGNLLGGGGGLGAAVSGGLGVGAGHALGMGDLSWAFGPGIPALGAALKRIGGKGTVQSLEDVRNITRQRSPMFRAAGQDLVPSDVSGRDAMARTLLRLQTGQPVPTSPDEELP